MFILNILNVYIIIFLRKNKEKNPIIFYYFVILKTKKRKKMKKKIFVLNLLMNLSIKLSNIFFLFLFFTMHKIIVIF